MTRILTDYERGWLEALIDGEGSLSLTYGKQKTSPRPRIDIRIDISNVCLPLLEKAKAIFGEGNISEFEPKDNIRKKVYRFSVRTNAIRNILPQLDLIVKKRQKELLLEAASLIGKGGKGSRKGFQGGKMRPLWKDEKFASIKKELNLINRRGVKKGDASVLILTRNQ